MPKSKTPAEMTYEQAYQELESTVQKLERGDLPLEQAMALFERGQALAARCSELLEQAELKLKQLVPDEAGGYVENDLGFEDEGE